MRLGRLAAWGGVAGPLAFTAAWVVSSLLQAGHPAAEVQLSGLAAEDARDPQFMIAGFVVLGACSIGFGAALRQVTGRGAGPWLVMAGGAAAVAAGAFRRDRMLLPGAGGVARRVHAERGALDRGPLAVRADHRQYRDVVHCHRVVARGRVCEYVGAVADGGDDGTLRPGQLQADGRRQPPPEAAGRRCSGRAQNPGVVIDLANAKYDSVVLAVENPQEIVARLAAPPS